MRNLLAVAVLLAAVHPVLAAATTPSRPLLRGLLVAFRATPPASGPLGALSANPTPAALRALQGALGAEDEVRIDNYLKLGKTAEIREIIKQTANQAQAAAESRGQELFKQYVDGSVASPGTYREEMHSLLVNPFLPRGLREDLVKVGKAMNEEVSRKTGQRLEAVASALGRTPEPGAVAAAYAEAARGLAPAASGREPLEERVLKSIKRRAFWAERGGDAVGLGAASAGLLGAAAMTVWLKSDYFRTSDFLALFLPWAFAISFGIAMTIDPHRIARRAGFGVIAGSLALLAAAILGHEAAALPPYLAHAIAAGGALLASAALVLASARAAALRRLRSQEEAVEERP